MNLDDIIIKALDEDIGDGDHTTRSTIPLSAYGKALLLIKEEGILCGLHVAEKIFAHVDQDLIMKTILHDGDSVARGDIAFEVSGRISSILQCERLVLNFMQRLSGIATATARMVKLIEGFDARILDTRKTTPLLRELEKYAVRKGGGLNHRIGLYDMILIKDNHVDYSGGIVKAIDSVQFYLKENGKELKTEIEVRNFSELQQVVDHGGVDRIMLDNFSPPDLKKAVKLINGRFETEASGGINESNIRDYAATGVDFISVGALTHHIESLDMSLKAVKESIL
ncbi:MAG: carboxylating nicotinate-nucleotide diphosphorylase [Bacteroidetes bacterium]|nr:carboxylating nicotinate-nucleotide diphosphorylase [Bacteroidota bacterium]